MSVNFDLIKTLRQKTGIGLTKCKEALEATNGDVEEAIVFLRKQGELSASKKSVRATGEGFIGIYETEHGFGIVEVNCETDFVAKTAVFTDFATKLAQIVVEKQITSLEDLLSSEYSDGISVESECCAIIQRTGENVQIRRCLFVDKDSGSSWSSYAHIGNRAVSIVSLDHPGLEDAAKDVAVHVIAFTPTYIDSSEVPVELIEQEKEIIMSKVSDKPEHIKEKIIEGHIRDFLSKVCLMNQPSLKDAKVSIENSLKSASGGKNICVKKVVCWNLLQD